MKPGERIENYVLIEQIGRGGQAAVWSAEDEQLKRIVAVKTISLTAPVVAAGSSVGTISAEETAIRFRSEAKTIADLEHPFILPIYSFGQKDDWLYLIMRYMPGGTLRRLIERGKVEAATLVKLAEPIADALDMAHQKRIIHRDIKSVNILLDAQDRPYLADFGLSVTVGDASASSGSGTLAYMSPEQLRGESVDLASDLYAFGILLYEMLAGEVPRVSGGHWNLAQVTRGTPLPIPEGMSPGVADLLIQATALNKQERFPTAMAMVEALREVVRSEQAAAQAALNIDDDDDEGLIMLLPSSDPAVQASIEATKICEIALNKWADGAGRFRLYEEDFKYIDSFYRVGEEIGIGVSDAAARLMLRGALEYGAHIDYWEKEVKSSADRRAVTLQTLMSELHTARLRALQFLAPMEDSDPPAIPTRVAGILRKEPNEEVRRAGIAMLEARAPKSKQWRDVAFDVDIDRVVADLALHDPEPDVRQVAAHAVGAMRSITAGKALVDAAAAGDANAFEGLLVIRDTAGSLPPGTPPEIRARIFYTLSTRQFFQPGLPARLALAVLGFVIGWVPVVAMQFGTPEMRERLVTEAIGNGLASGVMYGALFGVAITLASELAARLRAMQVWARLGLGLVVGGAFSALAFLIMRRFYYFDLEPLESVEWFLLPAVLFTAGFAIASALTRRAWLRGLIGALGIAAALYLSHSKMADGTIYTPLIFFREEWANQPLQFSILIGAATGLVTYAREMFFRRRKAL